MIFNKATDHLQKGNYSEALNRYSELIASNKVSGPLYLNVGITYAHLDSLGRAKYYFLKARQYPVTKDQSDKGLQLVNSQLQHHPAVLPTLPWQRVINWLRNNLGYSVVFLIGALLLNGGVAGIVISWFKHNSRSHWARAGKIITLGGVLIILVSVYMSYLEHRYTKAVLVTETSELLKKPKTDSNLVTETHEGYTFTVDRYRSQQADSTWLYVRMTNGQQGWINRSDIMIL